MQIKIIVDLGWALRSMTDVFKRERKGTFETHRETLRVGSHMKRDRDWSDAATSQGMPRSGGGS